MCLRLSAKKKIAGTNLKSCCRSSKGVQISKPLYRKNIFSKKAIDDSYIIANKATQMLLDMYRISDASPFEKIHSKDPLPSIAK